ncbi:MAG: hypothetical protein JNL70_12925 [Saprospiraceae bacterium]|nr:hypothetical protein [Saprospiraceae bacterium]
MKELLYHFDHVRATTIRFLSFKFKNSRLTLADFEDAFSSAFEKLLLDANKSQPTLLASVHTICYLSNNAIIDIYRKRKRETLVGEWLDFYPLSTTDFDDDNLARKQELEHVISQVASLPNQRKALVEAKYDARFFDKQASNDEIIAFKNKPKQPAMTTAMRQELFRGINALRTQLRT